MLFCCHSQSFFDSTLLPVLPAPMAHSNAMAVLARALQILSPITPIIRFGQFWLFTVCTKSKPIGQLSCEVHVHLSLACIPCPLVLAMPIDSLPQTNWHEALAFDAHSESF